MDVTTTSCLLETDVLDHLELLRRLGDTTLPSARYVWIWTPRHPCGLKHPDRNRQQQEEQRPGQLDVLAVEGPDPNESQRSQLSVVWSQAYC